MADAVDTSLLGGDGKGAADAGAGAAGTVDAGTVQPLLDVEGKPVVGADGKAANLEAGQKQELKDGKPVYGADGKPVFAKVDATVPEKYDFKMPEGVKLDEAAVTEFSTFAKDAKLPQESAQKVVDMGIKLMQNWQTQQTDAWKQTRGEWVATSKADKEFGGDKLAENLGGAKAVIQKYGTPELMDFINKSGIGDHPEFIRFAYRVAKATKEDGLTPGRTAGAGDQNTGLLTYGASQHA